MELKSERERINERTAQLGAKIPLADNDAEKCSLDYYSWTMSIRARSRNIREKAF